MGSQLEQAAESLGRGLLAAETTNASGLSADRQAPFNVLWHMAWEARSSVSARVTGHSDSPQASCCDLGNTAKGKLSFLEHRQPTLAFSVPFSSFLSSTSIGAAFCTLPERNRANIT